MTRVFRSVTVVALFIFVICFSGCKPDDIEMFSSAAVSAPVSLAVNPTDPGMAPGTTVKLKAVGTLENNLKRDVTGMADWSSSNPAIATVSETGIVEAVASSGTTTIFAEFGTVAGSTAVAISPVASISLSPEDPAVAPGTTAQVKAMGTLQNSKTQELTNFVSWTSSESFAAVSTTGLISASAGSTGTAVISAAFDGVTGNTILTVAPVVSIDLAPSTGTVVQGASRQFTATAVLSNSRTQNVTAFAEWSSLSPGVAVVSGSGLAVSASPGTALITASFGAREGSAVLTVTAPSLVSISVIPESRSIPLGSTQQFAAQAAFSNGALRDVSADALWLSSHPEIAAVSNSFASRGLATALSTGTARISAVFSGITSNEAVLTVTPSAFTVVSITVAPLNPFLSIGGSMQFTATGTPLTGTIPIDLTATVLWTSSNPAVAFVSQGFVTAVSPGSTIVTATSGNISGSTVLTVTSF